MPVTTPRPDVITGQISARSWVLVQVNIDIENHRRIGACATRSMAHKAQPSDRQDSLPSTSIVQLHVGVCDDVRQITESTKHSSHGQSPNQRRAAAGDSATGMPTRDARESQRKWAEFVAGNRDAVAIQQQGELQQQRHSVTVRLHLCGHHLLHRRQSRPSIHSIHRPSSDHGLGCARLSQRGYARSFARSNTKSLLFTPMTGSSETA